MIGLWRTLCHDLITTEILRPRKIVMLSFSIFGERLSGSDSRGPIMADRYTSVTACLYAETSGFNFLLRFPSSLFGQTGTEVR